jgi:hypothetical protein
MQLNTSQSEIIQSNTSDVSKNSQPDTNVKAAPKVTDAERHHLVEKINALCDCV